MSITEEQIKLLKVELGLSDLSAEQAQEILELREAWGDLVNSMGVQPVIYNDDGEPVWAGEWVSGANAVEDAEKISKAKMAEYERIGDAALADSLPLDKILRSGQVRFS